MDTYIANIFVVQLASHDISNKDIYPKFESPPLSL